MKNKENSQDCFKNGQVKLVFKLSLVQLFVMAGILIFYTRLWNIDLSVPFSYWGDTVWFTVPIKGMVDNGWVYTIPQLSAPFELSAAAFPSMTHTDWLVMKVVSLFTTEPGAILNLFWFCSVVFSAWTSMLALKLLGAEAWLAAVVGVIYATLPFALLRNVVHISLVYYCVPLLCLMVVWIAQGCPRPMSRWVRWFGWFAAIAQGLNYIYYSFFVLLLLGFAGWLGSARIRSWRPIKEASVVGALILAVASINLVPSFYSWHVHGKPPDMGYKSSVEAEIYGLKIRKMLAPNDANQLPGFSHWGKLDTSTSFPNENENLTARLGPMAAVGMVFLFMVILGLIRLKDNQEADVIKPMAAICIFAVLFATVGGLGAIFNLIIVEFRTYNRISVFIAFFALAAVALWWQSCYRAAASTRKRALLAFGLVCLVSISLYDQLLDFRHLRNQRPSQEAQTEQLRALVKQVESVVPSGSSVFQLPITGFPPDGGKERMLPYDHGRAYIASTSLRWSWPSFSQRHRAWQNQLAGLEGAELAEALVLSNFRLVWLDRFGYADNGEKIKFSLIGAGAEEVLPDVHPRYVILDMHRIVDRLKRELGDEKFEQRRRDYLDVPRMDVSEGFYFLEHNQEERPFYWSQKKSALVITNFAEVPRAFELSFFVAAGKPGTLKISAGNQKVSIAVTGVPRTTAIPLTFAPGEKLLVRFEGDMGRADLPPGETRDLHFYIMDMKLRASRISEVKSGENRGS